MQNKLDWSDVPVLLAFGRTGTIADAAAVLGIDETTAARRLKRLEAALGNTLVTKSAGRLSLTPVGKLAVERARMMEEAASELVIDHAERDDVRGTVRITGLGYVLNHIVIPMLPALTALHPQMMIQIQSDNRNLDVATGETDIAVRMAAPEGSRDLNSAHVCSMAFAAYRPRNKFHGVPMKRCLWIAPDEEYAKLPEGRWLNNHIPKERVILRTNFTLSNAAAVKAGLGCAVLPVLVGDNDRDMARIDGEIILRREVWLLWRRATPPDSAIGVTIARLKRTFKDMLPQIEC